MEQDKETTEAALENIQGHIGVVEMKMARLNSLAI